MAKFLKKATLLEKKTLKTTIQNLQNFHLREDMCKQGGAKGTHRRACHDIQGQNCFRVRRTFSFLLLFIPSLQLRIRSVLLYNKMGLLLDVFEKEYKAMMGKFFSSEESSETNIGRIQERMFPSKLLDLLQLMTSSSLYLRR